MTSLLLEENLRTRSQLIQRAIDFLTRQVEESKTGLVEMGTRLLALSKDRSRSPEAEMQYRLLTIDYDAAQKGYVDLLSKLRQANLAVQVENQQMGEQWRVVDPAGLPDDPDFPNRALFALGGLGAGLILGISRVLWSTRKGKTEPPTTIISHSSAAPSAKRDGMTEQLS